MRARIEAVRCGHGPALGDDGERRGGAVRNTLDRADVATEQGGEGSAGGEDEPLLPQGVSDVLGGRGLVFERDQRRASL